MLGFRTVSVKQTEREFTRRKKNLTPLLIVTPIPVSINSVRGQAKKVIEVVYKKKEAYQKSITLYQAIGQQMGKSMEKQYYNFKMEQFLRDRSKKEISKKATSHSQMEVNTRVGLKISYSMERED